MIKMSELRKNLADLVRFELGLDQVKKLRDDLNIMAIPNLLMRYGLFYIEIGYLVGTIPQMVADKGYRGAVMGGLIIAGFEFSKYFMNKYFNYIGRSTSNEPTIAEPTKA